MANYKTKAIGLVLLVWFVVNFAFWRTLHDPSFDNQNNLLKVKQVKEHFDYINNRDKTPAHPAPITDTNGGDDDQKFCWATDVVYTWVNGSDPAHIKLQEQYQTHRWPGGYRDYNVMKYSIRSVFKYMPWVRRVHIVTNGQVPNWLDITSPSVQLVPHEKIFPDPTALPTFNSNAIEAQIHNIPGLAPCLLYLNDDMFLGKPIPRNLFVDEKTGVIHTFLSTAWYAPMPDKMKTNLWHRSVGFSNGLLTKYYYPGEPEVKHPYVGHNCYFMRKDILDTIYKRWKSEFDETAHHKFRQGEDTAIPFLQANVAVKEFNATSGRGVGKFTTWKPDSKANLQFWNDIKRDPAYCVCINDALDDTPESFREIDRLVELFEEMFPYPSPAEKIYATI